MKILTSFKNAQIFLQVLTLDCSSQPAVPIKNVLKSHSLTVECKN